MTTAKNKYVGNRYVPRIDGVWSNSKSYDPLIIVTYNGSSYTSKTIVPVGVAITNTDFWVCTGDYNAQMAQYHSDFVAFQNDTNNNFNSVNTNVLALSNRLEQIATTPQYYGALANNVQDDLQYLNTALSKGDVVLLKGNYKVSGTVVIPDGSIIISQNATISLWGTSMNTPIISMGNSVVMLGNINLWSCDTGITQDGGLRACINIGDGVTGIGVSNVSLDTVTCLGGFNGMGGISILGNSHDIKINRVNVPDNDKLNKPLCAHWGNFIDHYLSGGAYVHGNSNGGLTTHPYNIHVGNITCGNLTSTETTGCGAWLSACRNVTIDTMDIKSHRKALYVYAGDIGFGYASANDQLFKMCNIAIGRIKIEKATYSAIDINGISAYESLLAEPQVTIGSANCYGDYGNASNYYGLSATYTKQLLINNLHFKNFNSNGATISTSCENVTLINPIIENCGKAGIFIAGITNKIVKNISIINPKIYNYAMANSVVSIADKQGIYIGQSDGVNIEGGVIGDSTNGTHGIYFGVGAKNIKCVGQSFTSIGGNYCFGFDASVGAQSYIVCEGFNPYNETMLYFEGGSPITMTGQQRFFTSTQAPTTGTWKVGDVVYNSTPAELGSAGSKYIIEKWVCTVAGTAGTWLACRVLTGN